MKIWFAGNSARKEREYLWQKAGAKNRLVSFFYLEDKKKTIRIITEINGENNGPKRIFLEGENNKK